MKLKGIILDHSLKPSTKVYRYMRLSQFMSFIENKKIYLTKLLFWEDTWEIPSRKFFPESEQCLHNNRNTSCLNDLYGQCWSLEGVSDALWRIYSRENEGILIRTSIDKFKLIKEIEYAILAPVIYYNNLEQVQSTLANNNEGIEKELLQGLFKRKAFEHEKEVRLITLKKHITSFSSPGDCSHIEINLDPLEFIEEIIIDPRGEEWYIKTMKEYCKRVGFNIVPKKSDLYCSK